MTTCDLVAAGDVMVDVLAPALSERPTHAAVTVRAGGSAVNAARAAGSTGRTAAVVGCVGDDGLGRFVREELRDARLEARLGVAAGRGTGRAVYAGGAVVADRGANAAFSPEHVPDDLRGNAVLVSGYQLLREDSGAGARAALGLGELKGVDVGSSRLVRAYGVDRVRALLAGVDVVFGGEDAVAALGTIDGTLVVTTLGSRGARVGELVVGPPRALPGDPIGAGDAFAGVFLVSLVDGLPLDEALRAACAAGAAVS